MYEIDAKSEQNIRHDVVEGLRTTQGSPAIFSNPKHYEKVRAFLQHRTITATQSAGAHLASWKTQGRNLTTHKTQHAKTDNYPTTDSTQNNTPFSSASKYVHRVSDPLSSIRVRGCEFAHRVRDGYFRLQNSVCWSSKNTSPVRANNDETQKSGLVVLFAVKK